MPVDVASIRQAIEEYVAGIETPEFADGRRLEALPAVLDRLAASAHPTTRQIGEASIIVGDAIDDLADIYEELKETLWRWEHTSQDDALWHFAWSY